MRPCLTCGEPSDTSYCDEHDRGAWHHHEGSASARGYDNAWNRLSKRARRLQPFCLDCGSTDNLTADHKPSAWQRKAEGKLIRLVDVDVVCGPCNRARGTSRPGSDRADQGPGPRRRTAATAEQPQFPLHTFVGLVLVVLGHNLHVQNTVVGEGHDDRIPLVDEVNIVVHRIGSGLVVLSGPIARDVEVVLVFPVPTHRIGEIELRAVPARHPGAHHSSLA